MRFEYSNHVITGELKVKKSRNHSPILLSIPAHWSRNDREILVQMLFEKFNVPGLYIAERPLMALYGYGQHLTGLVLEFAHDRIGACI
jgi:actin-related protein